MKTEIKKLIAQQIDQERDYMREHKQILSILEPLEGKPITGTTLNKKRLSTFEIDNGYPYTLSPQYGMFHIKGKYDHLIGYKEDPFIKLGSSDDYDKRGFQYFDQCHGSAAEERIKQLQGLDIDKVAKIFGAIKKNIEGLKKAFGDVERENLGSFHNPIYYQTLKSILPENKHVTLTNFYFLRK